MKLVVSKTTYHRVISNCLYPAFHSKQMISKPTQLFYNKNQPYRMNPTFLLVLQE